MSDIFFDILIFQEQFFGILVETLHAAEKLVLGCFPVHLREFKDGKRHRTYVDIQNTEDPLQHFFRTVLITVKSY